MRSCLIAAVQFSKRVYPVDDIFQSLFSLATEFFHLGFVITWLRRFWFGNSSNVRQWVDLFQQFDRVPARLQSLQLYTSPRSLVGPTVCWPNRWLVPCCLLKSWLPWSLWISIFSCRTGKAAAPGYLFLVTTTILLIISEGLWNSPRSRTNNQVFVYDLWEFYISSRALGFDRFPQFPTELSFVILAGSLVFFNQISLANPEKWHGLMCIE